MAETTILIAEDSEVTQKVLKFMLSKQGYKVVSQCLDGEEAVRQFRKFKPDIVLMDIAMPKKDGITATREIMAIDSNASVIVVTALYNSKIKDEAITAGAKGCIIKPFEFHDILRMINQCLEVNK